MRYARSERDAAGGDAAGPGAVHPRRLRAHQIHTTTHQHWLQVRSSAATAAVTPRGTCAVCGAASLQGDGGRRVGGHAAARHVPHAARARTSTLPYIHHRGSY